MPDEFEGLHSGPDSRDAYEHQSDQRQTSQGGALVKARFPWDPIYEERYGDLKIREESWETLIDACYPNARTVRSVLMVLAYCWARKLDPFKKPVHIVSMWHSGLGRMVETVWPGIAELRTTAFRTGQYAGMDDCEFGPSLKKTFTGEVKVNSKFQKVEKTIEFPEWARITVYRKLGDTVCRFAGPKTLWLEAYATIGRTDVPNDMWENRTIGQLEKVAEAAALRRAFPEEIGSEYSAEEMAGRVLSGTMDSLRLADNGGQIIEGEVNAISATAQEIPTEAPRPVRGRRRNAAQANAAPEPSHPRVVQEAAPAPSQAQETTKLAAGISPDARSAQRESLPQGPGGADTSRSPQEQERPNGPAPQETKAAEPNKLSLTLAKFQLGLSKCETVKQVTEFGTAWRDEHHRIRNGTPEEQGVAARMIKDYETRLEQVVKEAEAKRGAASPPAEAPQLELGGSAQAQSGDDPAVAEPASKAPDWPPEVEARIAAANSSIVRGMCEEIWDATSIEDIENKYAEIGAREEYPLLTGNERMAFYKAREASAARFIRGH
jgi:phage recombination protein Bet